MGQKVNPISLRLGVVKTWESKWYAGKKYSDYILEDFNIRKFLKKKNYHAGVSKIEIERSNKRVRLKIFTSRPGIIIGKKGTRLKDIGERARREIQRMVGAKVYLKLFVRVQKNWSNDAKALQRLGYL